MLHELRLMIVCAGLASFGARTGMSTVPVGPNQPPETDRTQPVRPILTLAEAKQMGFEHNWDLLATRSDVDLATAQRLIAHEFPNPTLSWTSMKIGVDRNSGTRLGNGLWDRSYDSIAAVNQLFEIGGKRANRQASARAGLEAAEARLKDARRILDLGVTKAYLATLLAETNVQILLQSAASLRKEAGIAETRQKAGDISRADRAQIEIAADRLELDARTAETTAAGARIAVEVLLGLKQPQGNWAPGDTLDVLASLPFTRQESSSGANRPDLVAVEAAQRQAEADVRLQKALRIPDPTVMLLYEHEPPDAPNTIGIGLSFPIPLWNRNRGGIQAATAAREQANLAVEKLKAGIAAEVNTASLNYADASARLRQQRDQIQPKSAEVVRAVSFAYEKGGASLIDLLNAERNDNEIRLATAQAMVDAASAAATLRSVLNLPESRNLRPLP